MSQRYGQSITWSTTDAPHPFHGDCTSYSARDALTRQLIDDESGDHSALVLHSRKVEINFEAIVRSTSSDFLNLKDDKAALTISGISSGVVLCSRAVEKWALGQAKTASIAATHYPDMTEESAVPADNTLSAFTPSPTDLTIVNPGSTIIYSTFGLGHASGIVHGLTLTQQLTIAEDDPTPDGKIIGAATHGYLRTIQLELLLHADADLPAVGTVLAFTSGAPSHATNYRIENIDPKYAVKRGRMCSINAVWIPPFN
jgi:hypothetical protein